MIIYRLKCKQKTKTIDEWKLQSKNGGKMIKGNCLICGTKTSVFVSSLSATKLRKLLKEKASV